MSRTVRKGAEDAQNQLSDLLDAAQQGRSTIITRHGRPVAALVPMNRFVESTAQRSLLPVKGSGRGLWNGSDVHALRTLRDEWTR
jgi:prevent-host-death family protein